jgi:hypothetical protein
MGGSSPCSREAANCQCKTARGQKNPPPHVPIPTVGFGNSNQPGFLTAIHMDNNQNRFR